MGEIQFAGNGKADIFETVSTAETPNAQGGSGDAVTFAGDGAKDVGYGSTDTSQHNPTEKSVPEGKGIDFGSHA